MAQKLQGRFLLSLVSNDDKEHMVLGPNKQVLFRNHEQIHFSMIQGRTIDVAGEANTFILIKANTSLLRVSMLAAMDKKGVINQPRSSKKHTVLADWVLRKCLLTQSSQ
jgi:hypothetical protein